jgi:hypothetical protein
MFFGTRSQDYICSLVQGAGIFICFLVQGARISICSLVLGVRKRVKNMYSTVVIYIVLLSQAGQCGGEVRLLVQRNLSRQDIPSNSPAQNFYR